MLNNSLAATNPKDCDFNTSLAASNAKIMYFIVKEKLVKSPKRSFVYY